MEFTFTLYVIVLCSLIYSVYLNTKVRERINGLHEHSDGLLKALLRERQKSLELRTQLSAALDREQIAEAALLRIKQDYEPSLRLAAKLNTARATGGQQDERLKHQNNEMRVGMSRMHRLMTGGDYPGAMEAWVLLNRWLEQSKIEPYLGAVPGVQYPEVAKG